MLSRMLSQDFQWQIWIMVRRNDAQIQSWTCVSPIANHVILPVHSFAAVNGIVFGNNGELYIQIGRYDAPCMYTCCCCCYSFTYSTVFCAATRMQEFLDHLLVTKSKRRIISLLQPMWLTSQIQVSMAIFNTANRMTEFLQPQVLRFLRTEVVIRSVFACTAMGTCMERTMDQTWAM